ncbi:MAG: cupin domain-containing protein [Proteobacteria bacterium]|nr:cupin domain-containing protein [Pseudomonadota bacterium]
MNADTHAVHAGDIGWVPLRAGLAFRPLRFAADGYSLQLRLEPGTQIPRHRHTGDVHAYQLTGEREILESGQRVGPGDYVYEPAGNVDSWRAIGAVPCVVQITLTGRVEYFAADGAVLEHTDAATARAAYLAHCRARGVAPHPRLAVVTG